MDRKTPLTGKPESISRLAAGCTLAVVAMFGSAVPALAQGLNWQGQTGAFITPFAYNSPSPAGSIGKPQVSFHYLDGGSVVGGMYQASITVGLLNRAEFGYTGTLDSAGSTALFSPLFANGFNTVHGKALLLRENLAKKSYLPAISVGFVARTQVRRVGGVLNSRDTSNGDFYLVATKTVTQLKALPILLNLGLRETDASVMGIAGNATAWQGRCFGAVGFVLKAPFGSRVVVGSEAAQEPHYIAGLPGATIPTSLAYFARVLPVPEKGKFNIDFGVAQSAGKIMPGVDLQARSRFAMGASYQF
ncbi:MAG: DUF3034 family protein [Terriglobales bacterium]